MKILNISYNNFMEIVKEKINVEAVRPHYVKKVSNKRDSNTVQIKSVDKERLLKEIKKFLKKIEHHNYSVNIKFHQKTKTYVIKIIDNETREVVKEAPLEKILDIISFMQEIMDQKRLHHRR
ncbi:MAG: hypothetical protein DRG39_00370 [Deltaproteobacteria bacterium]|nr:MAG: hypothetical protein DRG39_00370 [Deltaproteobacteria bacterium]